MRRKNFRFQNIYKSYMCCKQLVRDQMGNDKLTKTIIKTKIFVKLSIWLRHKYVSLLNERW